MLHANVLGGVVAYLMEALCMMGAVVMLGFLRALIAEARLNRKEAKEPAVSAEQVGRMILTSGKSKVADLPTSFRMIHSGR